MPKAKDPKKPAKAEKPQAAAVQDHSSQSEVARKAYEKLHGAADKAAKGGPSGGPPGPKKGFDPNQFKGGGKAFGGGGNQMMRRTQSRGGGSGGGGGGGGGGSAA